MCACACARARARVCIRASPLVRLAARKCNARLHRALRPIGSPTACALALAPPPRAVRQRASSACARAAAAGGGGTV